MDWNTLVPLVGEFLPEMVIVAEAYIIWRLMQRNDALVDKILVMSKETTEAMNALKVQVATTLRGTQ